jgi:uncharacterized protein YbcI
VTYDPDLPGVCSVAYREQAERREIEPMIEPMSSSQLSKELAQIALAMQSERTGHSPKAVTVVASEETVVLTLHEALTPAEKILASTESGAAKVEQYHRALFAVSCDELRKEIQRLTGRKVREAAAVVEPATGAIVHAFTSGTVVQIFQLEPRGVTTHVSAGIVPDPADPAG